VKWIKANEFGVDTQAKYDELDKVYEFWDEIISLTEKNQEMKYKDVRPFAGKADEMQKAYLSRYEYPFPRYEVNKNFVGKWGCLANYVTDAHSGTS